MCRCLMLFLSASCSLVAGCQETGRKEHADLASVKFRIVSQADESPLPSRELYIFDGRVEDAVFEFVKTKATSQGHYLTSVTTDGQGCFTLDLSDNALTAIVIQPSPPYDVVEFERASDTRHTKSAFHIRLVRFQKGTRKVVRNDIYDLRRGTVKQIGINGSGKEGPFEEVLIVAPELTKTAQPNAPADAGKPRR